MRYWAKTDLSWELVEHIFGPIIAIFKLKTQALVYQAFLEVPNFHRHDIVGVDSFGIDCRGNPVSVS